MKGIKLILTGLSLLFYTYCFSQEPSVQDAIEQMTEQENALPEDDFYQHAVAYYLKKPLDINCAESADLQQFSFLTDLQINSFLQYRKLAGGLLLIYELQAVPLWDEETIQKILPYIRIGSTTTIKDDLATRFRKGEYSLLSRVTVSSDKTNSLQLGSQEQVFTRLQYRYGHLLQWGLTGEKDPGESWFGQKRNKGFDFYSAHIFLRKMGIIKCLALGDYSVNIGQGLIHWQSMAFKKSPDIIQIKRQSPVLRPYHSSGEVFFQRGVGITIGKESWAFTGFFSTRKMDGSVGMDSINGRTFIQSWKTDGLHRTVSEFEQKNKWKMSTYGFSFQYGNALRKVSLNALHYEMSAFMKKADLPYHLFSFRGKSMTNLSADWSITHRNLHWFGELAFHNFKSTAWLSGLLISVDSRLSLSFVSRHISPAYQTLFGNAFTESASVSNERGFFAGVSFKPSVKWRIEGYADFFRFPWLKYRKDAPSSGTELCLQMTHRLGKDAEIITRFKVKTDTENPVQEISEGAYHDNSVRSRNWRTQVQIKINPSFIWRARAEMNWVYTGDIQPEQGFLTFSDLIFRPMMKPYSAGLRFQFFETDSYESRIYAYENDVLFRFSIPSFQGKGKRYYINLQYDYGKKLSFWLRWSQTILMQRSLSQPENKNQTGFNFQILYKF
jgi:hypothetical protein